MIAAAIALLAEAVAILLFLAAFGVWIAIYATN
jgi:hypothetical protein